MKNLYLFVTFFLMGTLVFAQKKPLDHSVYDGWESVSNTGISKAGDIIYYRVVPQQGDATLWVKKNNSQTITSLDRGSNPKLTDNEAVLVSQITPFFKDTRQARIDKKKRDEMPKDSLAFYSFKENKWTRFPNVNSYRLAKKNSDFLFFMENSVIAEKSQSEEAGEKEEEGDEKGKKKRPEKPTNNLVVYNFAAGKDTVFKSVDNYLINDSGNQLVFTRKGDDKDSTNAESGVFIYNPSTRSLSHIFQGNGTFKSFTFNETGDKLVFLADTSDKKALLKDFMILSYESGKDEQANLLINATTNGIPDQWYVSENGSLRFSKDDSKLFFGTAPIPRVKDTTLVDFEHAKVDIWHWQDDYLMTQQLANLQRDRNKNYLAVFDLKNRNRVVQLADLNIPDARTTSSMNHDYVVGNTDIGRRIETQWRTGSFQDFYIISTKDGSKTEVATNIRSSPQFSPNGKYVYWYDRQDQNWYTYLIETGETVSLTKDVKVSFANEDNDSPDVPSPYGQAGWTDNDEKIWLNDKYDIWSFNADGSGYEKLTNGRDDNITYRYSYLKERESFTTPVTIEEKGTMILSTFNHDNKEHGFAKLTFVPATRKKAAELKVDQILWDKYSFGSIREAKDAKAYIYTKADYQNSPDLYTSGDFVSETRISETNLQQKDYLWGTAELYTWTTTHGYPAEGILYKPENFDPNKTYPIIAYFYEKVSQGLYSYQAPAPTPSRLNIPYFVSNGYVVFAPDINYTIGHPGQSAVEYVNSGMESLKRNKWAGKMGIQGQSWGGYQVAHLITTTDMYDAAWSGAPVVNMTSAYGGIRWQTGMSRQFQYEHTQSRIGATLWERPDLYLENSPLFHFPRVTTPVAIMHNDEDGAVPWYQGIEMFTALRRLQKPVWLLNYNGDAHNLVQRQNRMDIQRREQQFFDHFLKGEPAAPWIEKGVPAVLKGIEWGFGDE